MTVLARPPSRSKIKVTNLILGGATESPRFPDVDLGVTVSSDRHDSLQRAVSIYPDMGDNAY